MMDKKEAREILGVGIDSSTNEIEKRYSILLKKHKLSNAEQNEGQKENNYSFEQVTAAYNTLMGYEIPIEETPPSKADPFFEKTGLDKKKVKNFFYYYKYHILVVIVALIILGSFIRTLVTNVDPDFHMAFIGDFSYTETQKLKDAVREGIPQIKEPSIDFAYISDKAVGEEQAAMAIKATLFFAAQETDVFVLDKANYERYAIEGVFLSLDGIAPSLGVDIDDNKEYILTAAEHSEPHLYGIEVTDSKVLMESGVISSDEMIAVIYLNGKQQETALKVLELLTK